MGCVSIVQEGLGSRRRRVGAHIGSWHSVPAQGQLPSHFPHELLFQIQEGLFAEINK